MAETKSPRLVHLTGLLSIVLLVVASLVYGNYDFMPPTEDILDFFEASSDSIAVSAYVGFVAAFFLMWFGGSLREVLLAGDGEEGRLAAPAFGGIIAAGVVMIVGYSAIQAAGVRAGTPGGISPEMANAAFDFYALLLGGGLPAAFAVAVGASSVSALRTGVLPRWVSFSGLLFTLGMISPLSYVFVGLGGLWIAVVSIIIFLRSS